MKIRASVAAAAVLAAWAGQAPGQVQHGVVNVVEVDGGNLATSVAVTGVPGFGAWTVDAAASSRGDYVLNFGTASDNTLGVFMVAPYQLERTEPSVGAGAAPYYAVSMGARTPAGTGYMVSTFRAGTSKPEVNLNSTVAYFPNADGWLAAGLYNSVNNGVITSVVGNVTLRTESTYTGTGNEVLDPNVASPPAGVYFLHSDTLDFRRDGVFLTCGAKDEDNRAAWAADYLTGDAYIFCQDLGADGGSGENDPASFVFITEGTPGVTMGVFTGTAKRLFRQGDWSVAMVGQPLTNGTFRLTIAGESPSSGTLMVAPYFRPNRTGNPTDNPVWAQPDGDGWLITTRDQPNMGLQDSTFDPVCSFAFLKNGVAITPGTPSRAYRERLDEVAAARFAVTEFTPDNTSGDMDCVKSMGSDIIDVAGANRGDNTISYLDALLSASYDNSQDTREGFILGSVSEFIRDNTLTGGVSGWSTFSFDNGDAVSHAAAVTGGEINSNFAVVHFPVARGFVGGSDEGIIDGLKQVPAAADALTDGVVMAINWDNNNRVIAVNPNGANYDLVPYEAQNVQVGGVDTYFMGQVAVDSVEVGYVVLPYSTPGLVAGYINADGTIASSSGSFTVSASTDATLGFPVFELTIDGVDARTDGMLLLNATGGPVAMAWEPGENGEFEIAGLDLLTTQPGLSAFSFAYIPFDGFGEGPACAWQGANCPADFNVDGGVDGGDIETFFGAWEAGDACADTNLDGGVDGGDIENFFTAWENGGC
jgi:hypothetical protein